MKLLYLILLPFFSCVLLRCDDDVVRQGQGQLNIEFDGRVGDEELVLDKNYINSHGEIFRISNLKYYISNIILKTEGGDEFVVPQDSSYFLVMENDDESQQVTIRNIPAGNYNQISFTIGIDSLRSTMDISKRPGALALMQGEDTMYWSLESGYIFFKMEGSSPEAPADKEHRFYYHIGGYGGYDLPGINNIRQKSIEMGSAFALVRADKSPEVHLHVDILEFFSNPTAITITDHPMVMLSDYSRTVSANYINMFKYDHVHN